MSPLSIADLNTNADCQAEGLVMIPGRNQGLWEGARRLSTRRARGVDPKGRLGGFLCEGRRALWKGGWSPAFHGRGRALHRKSITPCRPAPNGGLDHPSTAGVRACERSVCAHPAPYGLPVLLAFGSAGQVPRPPVAPRCARMPGVAPGMPARACGGCSYTLSGSPPTYCPLSPMKVGRFSHADQASSWVAVAL